MSNSPRGRAPQPLSSAPVHRPTFPEAVAHYETGIAALQQHRFPAAADAFRVVLSKYPEEKELHDRVRLYLALCERQMNGAPPEPATSEERVYAATLALNARRLDEALRHLTIVADSDPDNDAALYMLAVAHALRDDMRTAATYLERAVRRNPQNRDLALQEQDLERLLQDRSVRARIAAAAASAGNGAPASPSVARAARNDRQPSERRLEGDEKPVRSDHNGGGRRSR